MGNYLFQSFPTLEVSEVWEQPSREELPHWDSHRSLLSWRPRHWSGCRSPCWGRPRCGPASRCSAGTGKLKLQFEVSLGLRGAGGESTLTSSYGEIFNFIVQIVTVHIENNADVEDEEGDEQVGDVWCWNMIDHRLRWGNWVTVVTWHPCDSDEGPGCKVIRLPGGGWKRDGWNIDGWLDNIHWRKDVCYIWLGQCRNWKRQILRFYLLSCFLQNIRRETRGSEC